MKPYIIQDKIYHSTVSLHLCPQDDFLIFASGHSLIKRLDIKNPGGLTFVLKDQKSGLEWYAMWMKHFEICNNRHQSILHHEINHVALCVMASIQSLPTLEIQEPFAHLATFYYNEFTDAIKKRQLGEAKKLIAKLKEKDIKPVSIPLAKVCANCAHLSNKYNNDNMFCGNICKIVGLFWPVEEDSLMQEQLLTRKCSKWREKGTE